MTVDRNGGPPLIAELYGGQVARGHIERDIAQEAVVARLDALRLALADYGGPQRRVGALARLFQGNRSAEAPKGLYIHGPVGRGKTMLMDLFFEAVPVVHKRRAHFHAFMADVHARVHAWREDRKRGTAKGEEPIGPVADALADEAWLLCFDEFAVNDIADAMILGRLFQALFARGVVVVATSNVAPEDLYRDGLNRALFLPFVAMIGERMDIVRLESRTDFRLEKLSNAPVWHIPANDAAKAALTETFTRLTGEPKGQPTIVRVLGRDVAVPEAFGNVARFAFADLCQTPMGATDFVALANRFDVLLVDGIPVMPAAARNEARRFISLIDALYDNKVKLIASAAAEPDALYEGRDNRESFEFARTASRLIEMRSEDYLSMPRRSATAPASGNATGLVDT
jgi:cell division protein ZapE